ncbi:glutaminyl-peptide cyclotransferase [Backusella circina FSU 941]|nr:glutaminyl-peptide cyclotransferase [Backusella circina FSU 941]
MMKRLLAFILECLLISIVLGYKALPNKSLRQLAELSQPDRLAVNGTLLSPLLVPRVAGTPENIKVRDFIVDHFKHLGWHVELDTFLEDTPLGPKNFSNIIVTLNPDSSSRLVLAAHFDSKGVADFEFIGATDSAAPCAILMNVAETITSFVNDKSKHYRLPDKSLQFIFFDGEEAFVKWTDEDSIYGAKHLAETWEASSLPWPTSSVYRNRLDQIEVLVLLDLLGTSDILIPNYYRSSSWLYYKLMALEKKLNRLDLLHKISAKSGEPLKSPFYPDSPFTFRGEIMQDDHLPFLARGINVLHMIPYPFPLVWHNKLDNADCLDVAVIENWALIFRAFSAEYLELDLLNHNEL